jgi:hypothetical protein
MRVLGVTAYSEITVTRELFCLVIYISNMSGLIRFHILVTCIKLKRLQWAGHVQRMEGTRIPKKVFKAKFEGVRSVGKPRKRWQGAVRQDAASFLRCRNWKLAANDRTLWRQKMEETKVRFGL